MWHAAKVVIVGKLELEMLILELKGWKSISSKCSSLKKLGQQQNKSREDIREILNEEILKIEREN